MKRVYWNYEVGDQVLLFAKTLTTKVVFAVFKTKQRQRFIVTFAVIAKKGLSYTLNLQCKLRTVPFVLFSPDPNRCGSACSKGVILAASCGIRTRRSSCTSIWSCLISDTCRCACTTASVPWAWDKVLQIHFTLWINSKWAFTVTPASTGIAWLSRELNVSRGENHSPSSSSRPIPVFDIVAWIP